MRNIWNTEPAVIVSLFSAILSTAVAFGLKLTTEQTAGLVAIITLVAGIVTRTQVSPAKKE